LRQQLVSAVKTATEQEETERETRMRVGRALDELARDESRINREIDSVRSELDLAESQLQKVVDAMSERVGNAPELVRQGEQLSDQDATVLNQVLQATKELLGKKEAARKLRSSLQAVQDEREDLRFQMSQLKGRLGTLNAESTLVKEAMHDQTNNLDSEIQSRLDAIIPVAEQIVSHFMQDPSLRPLLTPHLSGSPPPRR
jgi:predicted  nucleic acid-binding Zn-ribbon protein